MKVLILNHDEVKQLLSIKECIPLMREALVALSEGKVHQPLRTIIRPPGAAGVMGLMPSYVSGDEAVYGLKVICLFPGNTLIGKDAHQGAVLLFSARTGELLALMNASAITAIRTAAVSAVATQALAREDARELAIIGAGRQARSHLEAMSDVRSIKRCRVASRVFAHAQAFSDELGNSYEFPIEAVETVEEALRGADLIVTATNSSKPVLNREWISPGAHLNAVGSSTPTAREVDTATVAAATLFVDRRESTINESGDYLSALSEGAVGPEHIRAEIGDVLAGISPGRISAEEITLFKSLGLAIEDAAAADYLYHKSTQSNAGSWIQF